MPSAPKLMNMNWRMSTRLRNLLVVALFCHWWSPCAQATMAFDAFTETASTTTDPTATHSPVGTPRAAIVWVESHLTAVGDDVSGCTYGGTTMTEVAVSPVLKTNAEALRSHAFFLGSSLPTGDQTVTCTVDEATPKVMYVYTLTAAADTEVVDSDTVSSDAVGDPSVTMQLTSRASFVAVGFSSGLNDTPLNSAPFTGWTSRSEVDDGSQGMGTYSYDTIDTADVGSCGYDQNVASEDATLICVAVSEVAGGAARRVIWWN